MQRIDDAFPKPHFLLRSIRSQPHVYSLFCKSGLFYSRHIVGASYKKALNNHKELLLMNEDEARHCDELKRTGLTVFHDLFDTELIDEVYESADHLFKTLRIDVKAGYSVETNRRSSLKGLTYGELESTEKVIYLDALLYNIPSCIPIAFNEAILKVVTNFLGYIPPHFAVSVVRDFPLSRPKEASNFHKDCDDADSVAAYIYLVDTTADTSGAFVYVPFSNRYDPRSCRPRLSRDLNTNANDGRLSDQEVEKYYPKGTWITVREKRGSVVVFHGNGIHKGPSWAQYGDARNQPRTAIRLGFGGFKFGAGSNPTGVKVREEDHQKLNKLQKLFTR